MSHTLAAQTPLGQPPTRSLLLDRGLNFHGGVSKALLNLARHADPSALDLEIGSLEPPSPEMLGEFGALGVPVHHLGDAGYLRPALALRRVLQASRTQVIVSNSLRSYLLAKLSATGLPVRCVFWVHGVSEIMSSGLKARIYRWISRRDTQIFVSETVRDAHLAPSHRGQHCVVDHGVEDPFQVPQWRPRDRAGRHELGLSADDQVLIYVASFVGYKDQTTLIHAVNRLRRQHPRLHLLLVGQGEGLPAAQELVRTLGAEQQVHFLGPRADARALLGLADLYVHPAFPEAFGLAVVEAMLSGLPVVAAADAGPAEIIRDGQTGLLFAPGDVDDLEHKLGTLLLDPGLGRRLGQAARLDGLQRFSPERFAARMTGVLQRETAPHSGPAAALVHP